MGRACGARSVLLWSLKLIPHKVSGWPPSSVSVQPRKSRLTLSQRSVTRPGQRVCSTFGITSKFRGQ